jgi:hypothetical protein
VAVRLLNTKDASRKMDSANLGSYCVVLHKTMLASWFDEIQKLLLFSTSCMTLYIDQKKTMALRMMQGQKGYPRVVIIAREKKQLRISEDKDRAWYKT